MAEIRNGDFLLSYDPSHLFPDEHGANCDLHQYWTSLTAICKLRLQIEASDTTLSNSVIERLWLATRDLLQPDQPPEAQMVALSFVCALLHAPRESLSDSNRTIIFGVIVGHETAEHVRELHFRSA